MKKSRMDDADIEFICRHYPREGCDEPMRKVDIARVIGCTDSAVEYQAMRMGFGKGDYSAVLERQRIYNRENRVKINEASLRRHNVRYRNDPEYRERKKATARASYHKRKNRMSEAV